MLPNGKFRMYPHAFVHIQAASFSECPRDMPAEMSTCKPCTGGDVFGSS